MADIRAELADAARRKVDAESARAEAIADITRLLRSRRSTDIPVAELARLSGVTRQTIYTLRSN
jgi:DNA-binding XRE family transcriptional regulator